MNGRRLRWVDVAKGACILLVVLWHVTRKDYLQLPWDVDLPVTGAWGALSELLLPVRMPLFFFVSGLVAAPSLNRPWGRMLSGRILPLLYLFIGWTLLHTVAFVLTPDFETAIADDAVSLLVQLTVTPGNLWYLLALACYLAIARFGAGAPTVTTVAAAALCVVATAGLVPTPGNRYGLLVNLVWFLLGIHAASMRRPGPRARALMALAFVPAALAWWSFDADQWLGVRPALDLLGIVAGVTVARMLAATSRVGDGLARIGRLTLPIYVLHLPLVALLGSVTSSWIDGEVARSAGFALVYPALATVVVVVACLALHRVLAVAGAAWLFNAPWTSRSTSGPRRFVPWRREVQR